jgi:hypothetical protein
MDLFVRVFYGGIVSRENCFSEDMEEELEMFDEAPSFTDLLVRLRLKFAGDFTLRGRFDVGKTRPRYVIMPLEDSSHWSRYMRALKDSNSPMPEVLVENGYRIDEDDEEDNEVYGGEEDEAEQDVQETQRSMDLDGIVTQEDAEMGNEDDRMMSPGHINDDFDVNDFAREEEEEAEEMRIDDLIDDDDDDEEEEEEEAREAPAPPQYMPVPMEQLHAMPVQGSLATDNAEYDAPFDSWATFSDARPYVPPPPYTARELTQLTAANVGYSGVPNYRDVSMTDMAVCDTGLQMCRESMYNHENEIISKGMLFDTLPELKLFLENYAVHHHRPYTVTHSNKNVLYQVVCKRSGSCRWTVNARKKSNDGRWKITSVKQPHTCADNRGQEDHPQLTARYLARRILGLVDDNNDISISSLTLSIEGFTKYVPKYGKVWRAKQLALQIRWGSWKEAYNRIPRILDAMTHFNPGLKWFIDTGGQYFIEKGNVVHMLKRVFWSFAQTEHAFQYCRPVVLVDGTFLTGKYRGVLMMAAAVDPENQIVPMAFALAEGENNESWSWFMRLLRVNVLGASRPICMISDRHVGLLNAAREEIQGYPPLVHRWCMRHFAANFWRRQRKKEVCDKVKHLCCVRTQREFKETKAELDKMVNAAGKAWLEQQMSEKDKWALAYDEGGYRYGIMTTNSSESFNRVFKGVRALPVSGIVEYSFHKCNEYFVKRWGKAQRRLARDDDVFGKAAKEFLDEAELWSKMQIGEAYGPNRQIYNVRGRGGTNLGGERYGGRNYRVDLEKVECTCNVPQIMHAPCSHMITACRVIGYDHKSPPYMSPLYLRANTVSIWQSSFEPYLDPTQWPPYLGMDYVPDPGLMKKGKGRRKKKRLKGDMDAMKGYGDDRYGGGDFDEAPGKNRCSVCHEPGHKASRHRTQSHQVL